jgi:hypothetical protein
MVLYSCVLIVFSLCRESLKLILVDEPLPRAGFVTLVAQNPSKALAKANKAAESSQETPPPNEGITESPEVMEIHSDWRTPFIVYLRTGGLPKDKDKCKSLCQRAG